MSRQVDVPPDAAFGLITDPTRLPEWNDAITRVLDVTDALAPGEEWVVELSALGQHWASRSRVTALDRVARVFSYRAQTDDGNPSYADWTWTVTDAPGGCEVAVTWQLSPQTFWRRALLGRIRQRQLRRTEVPASLAALHAALKSDTLSDGDQPDTPNRDEGAQHGK